MHDMRFISEVLNYHCMRSHKLLITLVCWYLVSYEYMRSFTSRNVSQISYILCHLLVYSGKSQLSNYGNANYLRY